MDIVTRIHRKYCCNSKQSLFKQNRIHLIRAQLAEVCQTFILFRKSVEPDQLASSEAS